MNLERVIAVRTSKTIYRDGDRVIKVFDEGYSKASVLNEALNQARVEETGLPVPDLIEVTKADGKWAIVTQNIRGKTLEQLMSENPGQVEHYMEQFIQIQMQMHAMECPLLTKLKDKMHRKISQTGLDATTRYDLDVRLDSMPSSSSLCHGDFNPSNIVIAEEDSTPYILDWSHATQGSAAADAARTYLLFWLSGNIRGAELYLDKYCKMSDTAKQIVQKWIPIVAASQLSIGKPVEREFLLHWIGVVDYQ